MPDDAITNEDQRPGSQPTLGSQAVSPDEQAESPSGRVGSAFWPPNDSRSIRALLTVLLVLAVIGVVVGGLIAGKPAGDMAQYVAPISSLASLALGYWFGAEK